MLGRLQRVIMAALDSAPQTFAELSKLCAEEDIRRKAPGSWKAAGSRKHWWNEQVRQSLRHLVKRRLVEECDSGLYKKTEQL